MNCTQNCSIHYCHSANRDNPYIVNTFTMSIVHHPPSIMHPSTIHPVAMMTGHHPPATVHRPPATIHPPSSSVSIHPPSVILRVHPCPFIHGRRWPVLSDDVRPFIHGHRPPSSFIRHPSSSCPSVHHPSVIHPSSVIIRRVVRSFIHRPPSSSVVHPSFIVSCRVVLIGCE